MNVNSSIDSSSSDGDFMKYTPKKIPKRSKYVDSSGDSSSSDDDSMEYTPKKMPKKSKYVNSWRDSSSSDDDSTEGKPQKNPKRNKPRKANVCVYCDKKFVQISQHLKMVHRNEPEMIKIMEGNLTWQERRKEFSKLVGKANFSYNCEAKAQSREADMILKYGKIDESSDLRRFISCKSCHHMYRTNSATRHKCVEDFRKNLKEGEKCRLVIESRQHWQIISSLSPAVRKLFLSLHPDEIADIIISDPTIIMFAEDRMEGVKLLPHENAAEVLHVEKFTQLRAKLRKAATFLKHFRVVSKQSKMTLREAFNPKNNRFLSQVGMKLSKLYTSPHTLSNLKTLLGHFFTTIDSRISHQKISRWAQYRKKFFYTWNNAIQPRVRVAKRNMSEISTFDVPTGAMMSKFNRFINNNLNELLNKEITTYQEYLELARFAFTRITTFNKRRGQEVARMTVKQFHRRVQGKRNVNVSELKMSKLDREIAKFHEVVTLKGKSSKNEIVYAILPINCVAAIEKLLEARGKFEGLENNDYVFAQLGSNNFHIPGPKTIRNIAIRAKVKPVEAFTAGKLRKYIATDMVWMNADPRLKTLLASQLGHNLSMHDDVYNENMRSSSTKFHKIPVILCTYEAGLTLNKPAEDVTDEDVLNYIKGSSRKDDEKKSLQNNSSSRRSTEDLNRIEELAEIVDDDDDDDGDDANDDNAKNRPWNGHNSEFRKSMFKSNNLILKVKRFKVLLMCLEFIQMIRQVSKLMQILCL
ncbi:uncharacterized protein LOC135837082 [Planococcus citri]|uniref:uncharacterized protein LOC135837082 n=1 Tax=Planococcus citri TaxID=170843 RepID=UPI0031F8ADC8